LIHISFIIATLNESARIERCLTAIRQQHYDQTLVEIIVCDGGSADNTVQLAKQYDCVVLRNPLRTAETGKQLGGSVARGALITALDADNYLVGFDWISNLVNAFTELPRVTAIFPQVVVDPQDNSFSQYFTQLYCDPFNRFVFGDSANPNMFNLRYPLLLNQSGVYVYDMSGKQPLIALAQAFTYRSSWSRPVDSAHDDILPVWSLIQSGSLIGYYPSLHLYHHSFRGFLHFFTKFMVRSSNALEHGFKSRLASLPTGYKARILLWFIYSSTVLGPLIQSMKWSFRDRRLTWLWHAPACLALTIAMLFGSIRSLCIAKAPNKHSLEIPDVEKL